MKKFWQFKSAELSEITDELQNPFRGWYQIYSFRAELEPAPNELIWCLNDNETCALVIIDISAYKYRDLDKNALLHMKEILSFFDRHRKDILLRVVYDREGKCTEHEPTLLSRVLRHIEQLEPILQSFKNRIVFFEGMLVGNWGEMHGSRFLTQNNMLLLNDALSHSAAGIVRAVRRPVQWRMLNSAPPAEGCTVGLYNDAIFGSDTDLGTYAPEDCDSEDWCSPWRAGRELNFEKQLGEFVPQCGEAVYAEECQDLSLDYTVKRLSRMQLTCLNGVYDGRLLNLWRKWTWTHSGEWLGMNGYDYIGRHLGYRFCVRGASARFSAQHCELTLTITNDGFAGFYQEAEALFVLMDEAGNRTEHLTDWDVRGWKSGQRQSLNWKIPCREGKLYLYVRRKWDNAPIRFANPSTEDGMVLIGFLK